MLVTLMMIRILRLENFNEDTIAKEIYPSFLNIIHHSNNFNFYEVINIVVDSLNSHHFITSPGLRVWSGKDTFK